MPDAVVDLGKTRCRACLRTDPSRRTEAAGAPGLSAPDGMSLAAAAVLATLRQLTPDLVEPGIERLVVGAAGALTAPEQARDLANVLHRRTPATSVAVTSDAVTAHLGALGGRPGVVVVAGTGAAAIGVDVHGALAVGDGLGPVAGDLGGGAWIGHTALRRALASGGALADLAQARYGAQWHRLARARFGYELARQHGTFVPDVQRLASQGDADARTVLHEAANHLASTARSTIDRLRWDGKSVDVAVVGGLVVLGPLLLEPFGAALGPARLVPADGCALDGAALLLERHDLPHEASVIRVGGVR